VYMGVLGVVLVDLFWALGVRWDTYTGERANASRIRSAVYNQLSICNLHLHYRNRTLL
jgi:hypothetical protein